MRYIELSEDAATTIRRANAIHPVTTLLTEYSLWSRVVEYEILSAENWVSGLSLTVPLDVDSTLQE